MENTHDVSPDVPTASTGEVIAGNIRDKGPRHQIVGVAIPAISARPRRTNKTALAPVRFGSGGCRCTFEGKFSIAIIAQTGFGKSRSAGPRHTQARVSCQTGNRLANDIRAATEGAGSPHRHR